jgi:hypothetical protein
MFSSEHQDFPKLMVVLFGLVMAWLYMKETPRNWMTCQCQTRKLGVCCGHCQQDHIRKFICPGNGRLTQSLEYIFKPALIKKLTADWVWTHFRYSGIRLFRISTWLASCWLVSFFDLYKLSQVTKSDRRKSWWTRVCVYQSMPRNTSRAAHDISGRNPFARHPQRAEGALASINGLNLATQTSKDLDIENAT